MRRDTQGPAPDRTGFMTDDSLRSSTMISPERFRARYRWLILLAWVVTPLLALPFVLFIGTLTPQQMKVVLFTPIESVYLLGSLFCAWICLGKYGSPLVAFVRDPQAVDRVRVLERMSHFPRVFWLAFLLYNALGPSTVLISAELYTDYRSEPIDWFRVHLVALTVAILVGLPIFFRFLDLLGELARGLRLERAQVTVRAKVFLIGSLVPLLVGTVLVQYYWTRTGFFSVETLSVWLTLEVLAIVGSLMFMRSFGQALAPLEALLASPRADRLRHYQSLAPQSTDELGVLTTGYRQLLDDLNAHTELLSLSNRVLREHKDREELGRVVGEVLELCRRTVGGDRIFMFLYDAADRSLVAVAESGKEYNPDGYFRAPLDQDSLMRWTFVHDQACASTDTATDPRGCRQLHERIGSRSLLCAPLRVEGEVVGVLMSSSSRRRRHYSNEEVALMEAFAREAALSLHTNMLYRERATAESERREREEQVRLLLEHTAEGIFGVDLEGTCIFVNPAALRMLGYEHEAELVGRNLHTLVHHSHPDGTPYPKEQCRVRQATQAGKSGHSDAEVHWRKDGSCFPVEWWSHPAYRDGEVIGTVVTFVDTTERRRAESRLKRLSEYNRLLLESTGDGIFGVDEMMRCTFVNRSGAEMLGFLPEELLGRDMHELVHHSDESGARIGVEQCLLWRTIRENRSFWTDEAVLWHQGKSMFPVQYSSNPIHEQGEVRGAVVVFRNVAEARAMTRKMDYLATHDPLTGLYNRREFERRLESALESARAQHRTHTICYVDLDQFKVVNDTCGHVAGDELLRQVTTLLHDHMQERDTLARLGGDEFGVLFAGRGIEEAMDLANDLRAVVEDFRFVWNDKTFSLGASMGLAEINADTETVAAALSAADAACYMAKDSGRNRVHAYQTDDAELSRRRSEMQWVSRIHEALDQNRFELAYQAIVPVAGHGADTGMHLEILVRMLESDDSLVPPGAFLPAAERYGLMPAIDRWVLEQTLVWLTAQRGDLDSLSLCTINLSGHSISEERFLQFVFERIEASGIPAEKLCFEITETTAVANLSRAVTFIRKLQEYGCRFALDDFGSGMSSFAYLKNLPVNFLKIDGNFVRDLVRDPIDRAMVEAINQVGHVMGIQTIAEFVESDEILQELRDIGVDYAQGYGIARPRALSALSLAPPATQQART